jgi:hypothetical protein
VGKIDGNYDTKMAAIVRPRQVLVFPSFLGDRINPVCSFIFPFLVDSFIFGGGRDRVPG